jgi:hypothetical protein
VFGKSLSKYPLTLSSIGEVYISPLGIFCLPSLFIKILFFIEKHKSLDHDCMITYLFGNINQPIQEGALSMDVNMGSYHSHDHNWLTHYPGPGDIHPDGVNETYGSYFPLVRLSKKALDVLVEEHLKGNYGYSEGYVPTILNHKGLSLYSIYNPDNQIKVDKNITVHHRRYLDLVWQHV